MLLSIALVGLVLGVATVIPILFVIATISRRIG